MKLRRFLTIEQWQSLSQIENERHPGLCELLRMFQHRPDVRPDATMPSFDANAYH
jgi:hypothetical protein